MKLIHGLVILTVLTMMLTGCGGPANDDMPGIFAGFEENKPASGTDSKTVADCQLMSNEFQQVGCYSDVAVQEGDVSICDNIKMQAGIPNCITQVAKSKKDATICNGIEGDHPKTLCLVEIGTILNDVSVCDNLDSDLWKGQCTAKLEQ